MLIYHSSCQWQMWDTVNSINHMDFDALLAQLRTEREMLEEAILAFERLARGSGKRRGRPPKWLADMRTVGAPEAPPSPAKKRVISADARKRMAEAQRKRWAAAKGTKDQEG
jgi:hypothetical protein